MVKLSDFVGELINDLAVARTYADYSAASASEIYHADPFIKNLPIPHYIIDEAEINVPVMVIGVSTQSEDYTQKKQLLNDVLNHKLSGVLLETFKWNYINERVKAEKAEVGSDGEKIKNDFDEFKFDQLTMAAFEECIKEIVAVTAKKFAKNLELYNYAVLKLLEINETFSKELKYALIKAVKIFKSPHYKKANINPFPTKESVNNAIGYVSNIMFFNFKKIMKTDASVHIDVNTSKMNEYAQRDCLMHIKLKIKEQDLNLIVEQDEKKEKRFLSLT